MPLLEIPARAQIYYRGDEPKQPPSEPIQISNKAPGVYVLENAQLSATLGDVIAAMNGATKGVPEAPRAATCPECNLPQAVLVDPDTKQEFQIPADVGCVFCQAVRPLSTWNTMSYFYGLGKCVAEATESFDNNVSRETTNEENSHGESENSN